MQYDTDTICAIATPAGRGGISIIRLSGPASLTIAHNILHTELSPRLAHYGPFYNSSSTVLDEGISLFFPNPNSFTGEDVVELQAHGGPVVIDLILQEVLALGARLARPGEFSERAFLNNKIDLTQAEAIADLIDSASGKAANKAVLSLQGEFSRLINNLLEEITTLRIYVEASIDFPEEEVDFLSANNVAEKILVLIEKVDSVLAQARQGSILREGISVVIAGLPNAGKSSLLNLLAGEDAAIVTDIAGTTRDTLKHEISIDGMPVHIIDTAGLRQSADPVEQEGIRRAWKEIQTADRILLLIDNSTVSKDEQKSNLLALFRELEEKAVGETSLSEKMTLVFNKIDLPSQYSCQENSLFPDENTYTKIEISAKHNSGLDKLKAHLRNCAGYEMSEEGGFLARRRHLDALNRCRQFLDKAHAQFSSHRAGELVAQDLKDAQHALGEITGEFTSDDLLGEIFSSFCIGK